MKPWTSKHQQEARAFMLRHAADLILRNKDDRRALEVAGAEFVVSEEAWRRGLSYVDGFGQNAAIDAAVRKVRALAEGRLVREPAVARWQIVDKHGRVVSERHSRADIDRQRIALAAYDGDRIVKVTARRIRRAP